MTDPQRRWSHVTYASFRNRAGGGGWHTGPTVGADQADEQLVMEYAPTSVVPTTPIDDFISAAEISELPRRFEYLPLEGRGLFMQSVPAGKDATGRPGNVFTHAVIDQDLSQPLAATYPINVYRSPDFQAPFRISSVDAVELDPQVEEPQPGPLTDLSVAWMMVTTMLGDRTGALYLLQDVLSEGTSTPVLTVKNANEAVYWLQALSSTLSSDESRRLLRFSTFERAQALPGPLPGQHHPVLAVPVSDKEALRRREGLTVIDPEDPDTQRSVPSSTWAMLTRGVLGSGVPPQQMVEFLAEVPGAAGPVSFGDALARMVQSRSPLFTTEDHEVAEQHLAQASPTVVETGRDADLVFVRRVIDDPRLVLNQQVWPQVVPPATTERDFVMLADAALDGIRHLATVSTDVLVGYLNFLLSTGLVPVGNVREEAFRGLFRDFDSFRGAVHLRSLPARPHPELRNLLRQADDDRKRALYARQQLSARMTQALGSHRSVDEISAWLRRSDSRAALQTWVEEEVIDRSTRDFSHDLLRVYFTVGMRLSVEAYISGERHHDDELLDVLTVIMEGAVERGVAMRRNNTTPPTAREFVDLGRRIAAEDFRPDSVPLSVREGMMNNIRSLLKRSKAEDSQLERVVRAVATGVVTYEREERTGEISD